MKIKDIFISLLIISSLLVTNVSSRRDDNSQIDSIDIIDFAEIRNGIVINSINLRLYPEISIAENQIVNVSAIITDDFFKINTTLRINIDNSSIDMDKNYIFGRYLKTFVSITRPGKSILYRLVGKMFVYNNTDVIGGKGYIDIPFVFKSTENLEEFRIRILAIGGFVAVFKKIDFVCYYIQEQGDIEPPTSMLMFT